MLRSIRILGALASIFLACQPFSEEPLETPPSTLGTGPSLVKPSWIVYHENHFYVTDSGDGFDNESMLVKVDASNGNREIFSKGSGHKGSGLPFGKPSGIVHHDQAFYVTDEELKAIVKVDARNGNREIFSKGDGYRGSGTVFEAGGIVYHNNAFYVASRRPNAVIKVDASSGNRRIFSSHVEAGESLGDPIGIVYHGSFFYVSDFALKAIVKVNAASGDREYLSRSPGSTVSAVGSGVPFENPFGIVHQDSAFYVTDFSLEAIVKVDARNGNRTIFSKKGSRGSGPAFSLPAGIVFHDQAFYVADTTLKAVVRVDATTGNRVIWSK